MMPALTACLSFVTTRSRLIVLYSGKTLIRRILNVVHPEEQRTVKALPRVV